MVNFEVFYPFSKPQMFPNIFLGLPKIHKRIILLIKKSLLPPRW